MSMSKFPEIPNVNVRISKPMLDVSIPKKRSQMSQFGLWGSF